MTDARFDTAYSALPDPVTQPGFYADVPFKRLIAFFFDAAIVVGLTIALSFATLGLGFFVFFGLVGIVSLLYRWLSIAGGSATWGMRLMAIELRNHRGERLTSLEAFLHTVAFLISFGMVIVQVISAIMMVTTPRGQGLADMLFGTVAINRTARR
ncbi:MAG: RDD family protein [Pseudomonadota bacterium]